MVFSSYTFLFLFLPITLCIYYIAPGRNLKNLALFVCSLVFYAWGEPVYIVLMIFSILNDYTMARLVDHFKDHKFKSKLFLVISIIINLGLLGFFKYYGFFVENVNSLLGLGLKQHNLALPIGISFYTFQTMSYTIDVYRRKIPVQKNMLTLATYVALFPQLIAGPIVRYKDVAHELEHRKETVKDFTEGARRFMFGMAKKVIIANPMGFIADTIYNGDVTEHGTMILWLAAIGFTLQIYFDFSGYSDMAIGLGKMFGFHFHENFNYPYIAKSITDFWRRWHISLSTWFRDYLYIPLGGNRVKALRWVFNLSVVWFVTGLWHGASWNYVLWGIYYLVLLLLEKQLLGKILSRLPRVVSHIYTLFLVVIGWVLFRLEDLSVLKTVLKKMFVYESSLSSDFLFRYQSLYYALPFILLGLIASTPILKKLRGEEGTLSLSTVAIDVLGAVLFVLSIIILAGESFNPFIYYRF